MVPTAGARSATRSFASRAGQPAASRARGKRRVSTRDLLALGPSTQRLPRAQLLLLLDNCEHVLVEVRSLVEAAITPPMGAHVLATSREVLGLRDDYALAIPHSPSPRGSCQPRGARHPSNRSGCHRASAGRGSNVRSRRPVGIGGGRTGPSRRRLAVGSRARGTTRRRRDCRGADRVARGRGTAPSRARRSVKASSSLSRARSGWSHRAVESIGRSGL